MISVERLSIINGEVDHILPLQFSISVPAYISRQANFAKEGFPIEQIPRTLDIFRSITNGMILVDSKGNGSVFDLAETNLIETNMRCISEYVDNKEVIKSIRSLQEVEQQSTLPNYVGMQIVDQELTIKAYNGTAGIFGIHKDKTIRPIYYRQDDSPLIATRTNLTFLGDSVMEKPANNKVHTYSCPTGDLLAIIMTTDGVEDLNMSTERYSLNAEELAIRVASYLTGMLKLEQEGILGNIDLASLITNIEIPIETANDDATILFHII